MLARSLIAAALLLGAGTAMAQVPNPAPTRELPYDRGYDKRTPKHAAIDAQEQPITRALNNASAARTAGTAAVVAAGAADQAGYEADMAAYRAAVEANARATMADEARYARQQRAYADAMAEWRAQTAACERGVLKSCKLATPNPADYY